MWKIMSSVSDDLDQNLGGDGFTLSRLLGGDSTPSPQTSGWDGLGVPTPPTSAPPSSAAPPPQYSQGPSAHSGPEYTQSGTQGSGQNNPANPGYRPWEAEQQEGSGHQYPVSCVTIPGAIGSLVTTQAGGQRYYPYTVPNPHLPSFQSQFHFNENEIPPPNTQAPPGPPVPTTGERTQCWPF